MADEGRRPAAAVELDARLTELGWNQTDLAKRIGVSPAVVSRWVSGERTPSLEMAFRIQNSEVGMQAERWLEAPVVATAPPVDSATSLPDDEDDDAAGDTPVARRTRDPSRSAKPSAA